MNEENPQYFEQIRWLEETLSMAKRNDEKVCVCAASVVGISIHEYIIR